MKTIARTPLVSLLTFALITGCGGEPVSEEPGAEIGAVVVTQWNDATELFLEYPHIVAGEQTGNWAIHLSDMSDFKPITSGTLTVRFERGGATARTFTIDDVARDGIFLLDPIVEQPGTYTVVLDLESPQVNSSHTLPEVTVFPSMAEAPLAEEEEDGGIGFLKEQQWKIDFAVNPAEIDSVRSRFSAPAEVVAPDGGMVRVDAPVAGMASAVANRSAPSIGQRVQTGQTLAVLAPDASEVGFAELRARVERLGRETDRAERLFAAGAIPERRLEEALHNLEVAQAQLDALGASSAGDGYQLTLTAPISGVVAERSLVPGSRVGAGEHLFTVVDPSTAWLKVHVPAGLLGSMSRTAPATFVLEGEEEARATTSLVAVGTMLDPATRTAPAIYRIAGGMQGMALGQLARAFVPTEAMETGVVVPASAIVDDNGTPVAYVQLGGETFEQRILTLGPSDGRHTLVRTGIDPGDMVVTTGAYQVRLASMSGGEFAGGHAH